MTCIKYQLSAMFDLSPISNMLNKRITLYSFQLTIISSYSWKSSIVTNIQHVYNIVQMSFYLIQNLWATQFINFEKQYPLSIFLPLKKYKTSESVKKSDIMSKNFDYEKKFKWDEEFFLKQLKYYYMITLTLGFCLPLQFLIILQMSASFLVWHTDSTCLWAW